MPRKKDHGSAVASSPLFALSPEIRIMIYRYVLVDSTSHSALDIHPDLYKRRKAGPKPCPYGCGKLLNFKSFRCVHNHPTIPGPIETYGPRCYSTPHISTSLLRTCRAIHDEAIPFLYRDNKFHFSDLSTALEFRWTSDARQSGWVKEIALDVAKDLFRGSLKGNPGGWKWQFAEDFPHLKRLIVALGGPATLMCTSDLRRLCTNFSKSVTGLDWLHVIGLNDLGMVPYLEPMVIKSGATDNGKKKDETSIPIQTNITEFQLARGWKNVTIWQGEDQSPPPYVPRPGDDFGPWQYHLYPRQLSNDEFSYTQGCSNFGFARTCFKYRMQQ
ncbi:MAG: hypothetical protein Q9167_003930 [Letrouitia subvulpina]